MNSNPLPGPILVTGGTGFLAGHTILQLLAADRPVRTTVRSEARGAELRAKLAAEGADVARLDIAVADLMQESGWGQAMAGVEAVLHMATPMQGDDVEAAALDGTRRVLEAAAQAGVRRIVFTSTGLAASKPATPPLDGVVTEQDWTDVSRKTVGTYARAKTAAEQFAWKFTTDHDMALTTILPGAILGPPAGTGSSAWSLLVGTMLAGKLKLVPPVSLHWVDARDLVTLHIAALDSPVAVGQRYIANGEQLAVRDLAQILRDDLGARAGRVSTTELPAWIMRFLALFSAQVKSAVPLLDDKAKLSAQKAFDDFGWSPRPTKDTLRDVAEYELAKTT
ncbi:MAG: NAD-dependent epimerase/dehydratase family protein [Proteobacteria bacterium]|nr:MAG: NAD-dependent epimerase/dehydratase family protein [Pseudomonadota bacterium]